MYESILENAKKLQSELVGCRRFLHEHAEVGFELENTTAFVGSRLEEMGYTPQPCGRSGLVATVGKAGKRKAFLLRADMDGLPIPERSGEPFACKNGNMHACGHDMHTAMLLGAAKLLKTYETELNGVVKLLFQPAEEILQGAQDTIAAGVLQNPEVGAAMALHVMTDVPFPVGTAVVPPSGVGAPAADYFKIEVTGKGCHGSTPQNGVDAISVAAHILLALQEIPAREISVNAPAVLTVGKLQGGTAGNVIADTAVLEGTLRAFDEQTREEVKARLKTLSAGIAKAYRAKAKVLFEGGCPTLLNDENVSAFVERNARELLGGGNVLTASELGGATNRNGGSEDFAYISRETPSVMLALAAGNSGEGYGYPLHHPKVRFDERALCIGAALLAYNALRWFDGE